MLSKLVKSIAVMVALVAIALGTIGKVQPTLFFKIPEIGFIFWAVLGGHMPPYFDPTPLTKDYFSTWTRDGDIVLATMPKSGTLWLGQIVYLLTHGGNDKYDCIFDKFGINNFLRHPHDHLGVRLARESAKRDSDNAVMQWATHEFPNDAHYGLNATLHPNIKYIVTARNGKEVIRSFYPFMNGHNDEFRGMWGGFPPPVATKEAAVHLLAMEMPDFYFNHLTAWWPLRKEPNVLFLHYSDMSRDTRTQIELIAKFLDLESSDDLIDAVVQKSSIDYMKQHAKKFANNLGTPEEPLFIFKNDDIHINKGVSGGVADFFTAEMEDTWNAALTLYWGDADPKMVEWAMHGGDIV